MPKRCDVSSLGREGGIEVEAVGVLAESLVLVQRVHFLHVFPCDFEVEELGVFTDALGMDRFGDRDNFVL